MVGHSYEEDGLQDHGHAQGQRSRNNNRQGLNNQNHDATASYEMMYPSYNPNPYASYERRQAPALNSSQFQTTQGQVFNPTQLQMMPPMGANANVSPGFGMMSQFQPGGLNPHTFGFVSNTAPDDYLHALHGQNTHQQAYGNLAANKWVQNQAFQRRAQEILDFNRFPYGNPRAGMASQRQSSTAFTSPDAGVDSQAPRNSTAPRSTSRNLGPSLSQQVKDNSKPAPNLAPRFAQQDLKNTVVDKRSGGSNSRARHKRAAFEGPGGALSRDVNASFDTSVIDLTRPNPSLATDAMEDVQPAKATYKRKGYVPRDFRNDHVTMSQATSAAGTTTAPAFPISDIVTTLPGNTTTTSQPTQPSTTEDIDDATTVRDPTSPATPSPSNLPVPAGPPSPPGCFALPSPKTIRRASFHTLWTARESAAVAHIMDWASYAFPNIPVPDTTLFGDDHWQLLSQRLATHYKVLRPPAVVRARWEGFLRGNYEKGVRFNQFPEGLRNLRRRWVEGRERNEEDGGGSVAAPGDKRKRRGSADDVGDGRADGDGNDNDNDNDSNSPRPANPGTPSNRLPAALPSSPQTFPRAPVMKLRRIAPEPSSGASSSFASDLLSAADSTTTNPQQPQKQKQKRKKAPSKHVIALARQQLSLPHAFSAARAALAHLRTASAHSVRGSFDSLAAAPTHNSALSALPSAAAAADPKDVKRLRVVGQKVLDKFAAKTGVLPRDVASEVLRKAVEALAPLMAASRKGRGRGGGRGGEWEWEDGDGTDVDVSAAFEAEEMDVDAHDGDNHEVSQEAVALKKRLEALCVGRGVSFVCREQEGYEEDDCDEVGGKAGVDGPADGCGEAGGGALV